MESVTRFVLRHRRWVVAGWLLLFALGGIAAPSVSKRLSIDFSLPGQPGYETNRTVLKDFGVDSGGQLAVLVMTMPPGQTVQGHLAEVAKAFQAARSARADLRVLDYSNTHDPRLVTRGGRATYGLVYAAPPREPKDFNLGFVAEAGQQASPPGASFALTGINALSTGGDASGPGVLLETVLGGLGALAVLAFVFASFMALVPLAVAAVSILTTFLILLGLTHLTDVSFVVQFLVALVGLGVAIDYSLLVVTRWREEREHGRDNHEAIVESIRTAGHAVLFSAGTVAIGLFSLLFLPVPSLRSMGMGGLLIPLVSMAVTLTLLPALLGGIGPRVDWPRLRHEDHASSAWTRWGAAIVRRRWLAAIGAGALLLVMTLPIADLKIGLAQSSSLTTSGPAYDALQTLLVGGVPDGVLTPITVLERGGDPQAFVAAAEKVPGVQAAFAPSGTGFHVGDASLVTVVPDHQTVAGSSTAVVRHLRSALRRVPGYVGVTGIGASQIDYITAVYDNFPLIISIIFVLTFILLVRAFRSVLLPLKAVVLNLVSMAATFGLVVFFWQQGHGSKALFGVAPTGAVTFWLPMLIFAFLFGLSMDYEVFILARMREEYDRTGSTSEAVVEGIGRTGRLVTSAALILFLAFVSLASSPQTDIRVFATALGVGILLDATIVRALLVPALISLFGPANWWMPDWLARLLRVAPSHPLPVQAAVELTARR